MTSKNVDSDLDISVLVPSRNRPGQLREMLKSLFAMASRPGKIEVLVYVDQDDTATKEVCQEAGIAFITGPRSPMGKYLRLLFAQSCGKIIILLNDDVIVRTKAWDDKLLNVFSMQGLPLLAYPNDLFKKRRLCTFPILDRNVFATIFDESMERYQGAFIDSHLLDIFQRLCKTGTGAILYLPDVIFEHMHYRLKKSSFDTTYASRDRFGDDDTYLALAGRRRKIAGLLQGKSVDPPISDTHPGFIRRVLQALLYDTTLPLGWRCRMTVYFSLRYA